MKPLGGASQLESRLRIAIARSEMEEQNEGGSNHR